MGSKIAGGSDQSVSIGEKVDRERSVYAVLMSLISCDVRRRRGFSSLRKPFELERCALHEDYGLVV